jgi:hypothetical protein
MTLDCGSPSSGTSCFLLPTGEGAERSEADEGEPEANPNFILKTGSMPHESPRARFSNSASRLHSEIATPEIPAPRASHYARDHILVNSPSRDSSRLTRSPIVLRGNKNLRGNAQSLSDARIFDGLNACRVSKTTTELRRASHFCDCLEPVTHGIEAFSSLTHRGHYG